MDIKKIKTIGELKKIRYQTISVKEELRKNMIEFLRRGKNPFEGIIGYDDTVIPELQTAVLSRHNIILLGLRGQAKSRVARLFINLLDEYVPIIEGSEINDDPFNPISKYAKDILNEFGDNTKIEWLHRSERFTEKLATPDVTVADLIGDVDPIKAASLKLPYSDERVIHFGLIPRSHRGIFVINELPDLQARIQVALFNILQENDIQIRGFKIRLPLDIQFIFTANPEDYTNRGSIVTPLKDRIDSQILTHYPKSVFISKIITEQEAQLTKEQKEKIIVPDLLKQIIEQIAFEARESEYVDAKSGVSARLTISAFENLVSFAERRRIVNNENQATARISDLVGVIPAITGKIELVYEGEQEGPAKVAQILIGKAIKTVFEQYFPNPEQIKKKQTHNPYAQTVNWFSKGNTVDLLTSMSEKEYSSKLRAIPGLQKIVDEFQPDADESLTLLFMEFIIYGLAEFSMLSKFKLENGIQFRDMLSSMFNNRPDEDFEGDEDSDFFR
ncbi:sigma 54-interacting transcriptional regulator [Ignavibacterium album]|uniref:sigma 54-interacting transcriptional regulator n=1 Tax=Ignavibacterium album TaxID=591197 RepID=UPI0026EE7590|nr:sigma 54-interacting transcriptional regulator [Ignavibacterium album]